MNSDIRLSLEQFASGVNNIFNGKLKTLYTYGSAVYDDIHTGYSDLDFLVVVDGEINENDFKALSDYRIKLKASENRYFGMLEGGFISYGDLNNDKKRNVVSWGGSGEKFGQVYGIKGFDLKGLIDSGIVVFGEDIRKEFRYPRHETMVLQIDELIETIKKYAIETSGSIHSIDWLFLMCGSAYYLKTRNMTSKTDAAIWAVDNNIFGCKPELEKAVEIRVNPSVFEDNNIKLWLAGLGNIIQKTCDELIKIKDKKQFIVEINKKYLKKLKKCVKITICI